MDRRFLWPAAGAVALVVLAVWIGSTPAQPGMGWRFQPTGRFVVAHASATQILILDTTTGNIYKAGEKDFKAFGELAKAMDEGGGFPGGGFPKDGPPFGKDGFGKKDGFFGKKDGDEKDGPPRKEGRKEGFGKKEGKKRPPVEKDD